ncbi:hypothetical protein ACQ4PT_049666 [Festuca glaucescens]
MGRGKVQLRRIENNVSRQVTFSKRRSGLLKKAHEIAVLCDADVAVIVFSAKGRLYEYSAHTSMDRILEQYERFSLSEGNVAEEFTDLEGCMNYDHIKLSSRIEALQKSRRNLMGEQLDSLTAREVQQLEQQIGNALRNIRLRKNHLLTNSIAELQNKERMLMEQNNILEKEKAEVLEASLHKNRAAPFCNDTVAFLPNLNIWYEDGASVARGEEKQLDMVLDVKTIHGRAREKREACAKEGEDVTGTTLGSAGRLTGQPGATPGSAGCHTGWLGT